MKATGIVRRIDDLGRVVIPKEIRRVLRIREGDPLEIFTDRDGEVIFKKYSPIGELGAFASQYAETLHKTCELAVVICDRDAVIASAGLPKREFADKRLSPQMESIMEGRSLFRPNATEDCDVSADYTGKYTVSCAMPIISDGDVVGCVVSLVQKGESAKNPETEEKLVESAASFLGRQLEA